MKPLAAICEYHYWSERLVTKIWQDNVARIPDKISFSVGQSVGLSAGFQTLPQQDPGTRASRAAVIADLLADQVVTDLDYEGPVVYLAGRSDLVLSSLMDAHEGVGSGAVTLFADLKSTEGKRVGVCLFGSAKNVCDCDPEPPVWRRFGWTSSTNEGVKLLLLAGPNAESADDPATFWREGADRMRADAREICWNAANICDGQGDYYGQPVPPWHRGFTIGHFRDVEWLAQIYFSDDQSGDNRERDWFDMIHVGAAFWVRSPGPSTWVPYTAKNVAKLDAARSTRLERPLAYLRYRLRGKHLEHIRGSKADPSQYDWDFPSYEHLSE